MQVIPKGSPSIPTPPGASARDRAVERLTQSMQPQAQPTPVPNPTQISPEMTSAVIPPTKTASQPDISGEATPQEVTSATEKKAEKAEESSEPLSSQYAQLARKEKALRSQVQQLQAREQALKAREAQLAAKDSEYQTKYIPKDKLMSDTLSVLNEQGITYDHLTQQALSQPQSQSEVLLLNEIKSLKSELQNIKGEQETVKKSQVTQQQQAYKQAVASLTRETKQLVDTSPEFETIKATDSIGDVVQLIEKTFNEEGTILSVEEAAKLVEDHLVEEAMKISRIKKIQQRMATSAAPVKKPDEQSNTQPLKTLTNNVAASRPLSAVERAKLAFEGKLK